MGKLKLKQQMKTRGKRKDETKIEKMERGKVKHR